MLFGVKSPKAIRDVVTDGAMLNLGIGMIGNSINFVVQLKLLTVRVKST